jgi:hypothetical protein
VKSSIADAGVLSKVPVFRLFNATYTFFRYTSN